MNEAEFGFQSRPTKHDIVSGTVVDGRLEAGPRTGIALAYEGDEHYVVILSMFPTFRYYLLKNKDSATDYTIFSRRVTDAGRRQSLGFHYPVGSGRLIPGLTTHMELRFPLLAGSHFMSLFGKD